MDSFSKWSTDSFRRISLKKISLSKFSHKVFHWFIHSFFFQGFLEKCFLLEFFCWYTFGNSKVFKVFSTVLFSVLRNTLIIFCRITWKIHEGISKGISVPSNFFSGDILEWILWKIRGEIPRGIVGGNQYMISGKLLLLLFLELTCTLICIRKISIKILKFLFSPSKNYVKVFFSTFCSPNFLQ